MPFVKLWLTASVGATFAWALFVTFVSLAYAPIDLGTAIASCLLDGAAFGLAFALSYEKTKSTVILSIRLALFFISALVLLAWLMSPLPFAALADILPIVALIPVLGVCTYAATRLCLSPR